MIKKIRLTFILLVGHQETVPAKDLINSFQVDLLYKNKEFITAGLASTLLAAGKSLKKTAFYSTVCYLILFEFDTIIKKKRNTEKILSIKKTF